uniref:Protein GrpE n=1 Tax=Desulfatirhabdium butyrativorans TaxID=340467 RepID=A0A7C4RN94_9BACT
MTVDIGNIVRLCREWLHRQWRRFDEKLLLPTLIRVNGYLSRKIENRIRIYHLVYDWKNKALEDFTAWLATLSEEPDSEEHPDVRGCDLFTLLAEFVALRQEIRIQNREQGKTLSTLNELAAFIESSRETIELFRDRTRALADLETNIRKASEKRTVLPFLDVRDALTRGLEAARILATSRRFWRPAPKGIEGVVSGYEMAIRRIDKALAAVDVTPIETVGKRFDSKTMKAIDKQRDSSVEKGTVVRELVGGFLLGETVLRTAEVVVSE